MAGELEGGGVWRGDGSVMRATGVPPCAVGPAPLSHGPLGNQQHGTFLASRILHLLMTPSVLITSGESQQSRPFPFHSINGGGGYASPKPHRERVVQHELVNGGLLLILQDPT